MPQEEFRQALHLPHIRVEISRVQRDANDPAVLVPSCKFGRMQIVARFALP